MAKLSHLRSAALLLAVLPASQVVAALAVPAYSSRPGAAYTIYLDFGGFTYDGQWAGATPGVVPAYDTDGNASTFSSGDYFGIQQVWARVAEKYVGLNVNVTTVDPAAAAGQAGTDAARQAYYDATAHVQHTIIGGNYNWFAPAGGVSYVGVIDQSYPDTGYHTNWVFPAQAPTFYQFIAEAASHENGHAFGLFHQADFGTNGTVNGTGSTLISGYSTNGNAQGNGSFAPVMGVTYYSQRGLWRVGASDQGTNVTQNDYAYFGANDGTTLVDDGVVHAPASAGELPLLTSRAVNSAAAKGFITPTTLDNPNPIGVDNYTKDYFRFFSVGTSVTLACIDGSETLAAGTADPGATLASTFKVFNATGTLVATATYAGDTLSESLTATLPAGNYYVEVASVGGFTSTFDASAKYFTSGSYFLTGSNVYVRSNLAGVNLSGADLSKQDMTGSLLTGANLCGAGLAGANFADADLTFADLRAAAGFVAAGSTVTRGTILPGGQIASFAFVSGETLSIASATTPASLVGTAAGPGTISLAAGARLDLATPASSSAYARTLDGANLALAGTAQNVSKVVVTAVTAPHTGSGALLPTITVLSSLSIADNGAPLGPGRLYYGLLDLGTNDALVHNGSIADLDDMARAFLFSQRTTSLGTTSSIPFTGLAIVANDAGIPGVPLYATFDGVAALTTDVLLKFTYTGDTDLNGYVDGNDLANLLAGENGHLTGWQNGDLNYDGQVNGTDLSLLMSALSGQGAPLGGASGLSGAVPEPAALGFLLPMGLVSRRRRHP